MLFSPPTNTAWRGPSTTKTLVTRMVSMIPCWVPENIDETTLGYQKRILHYDLHRLVVVDLVLELADGCPRLYLEVHMDLGHGIAMPSKSQDRVGDVERPLCPHWMARFANLAIKVFLAPGPGNGR